MKRLNMLLVPLFAMPLLVGCKIGGLEDTHMLDFVGYCCSIEIDGGLDVPLITNQKVTGKIVPDGGYTYPQKLTLTIGKTEEEYKGTYKYDSSDGSFSIKMISDVTITADATQPAFNG